METNSFCGILAPNNFIAEPTAFPANLHFYKRYIWTQQVRFTYLLSHFQQRTMTFKGLCPPKAPSLKQKKLDLDNFAKSFACNTHVSAGYCMELNIWGEHCPMGTYIGQVDC